MDDAKWERWAGLGGILFVILVLVSAFLPGNPPMQTDSTAKIARYFNQHRDDIRWAAYIGSVAAVPFLWWLGSVWARLRRSEGATPRLAVVAVAGGIFGTVMATAASLVLSTVAIRGLAALFDVSPWDSPLLFLTIEAGVFASLYPLGLYLVGVQEVREALAVVVAKGRAFARSA